jgi:succinylglutamate desuccinylase
LSALVHGNEVGGVAVVNRLLQKIFENPDLLSSKILFHLGNVSAALLGVRFIERDLNRSFMSKTVSKKEEHIAQSMQKLVSQCAFNIDLHQTNSASETPFFIFSYSESSLKWARYLDSQIPAIISVAERHKDGSTLDFYCLQNGIPSCTLELGQAGFYETQTAFGAQVLNKILDLPQELPSAQFTGIYKVLETIYWENQRIYLKEGFKNFSQIHKGDVLGFIHHDQDRDNFVSPYTGVLLFPKYGKIADQTKELVTFAVPVESLESLNI